MMPPLERRDCPPATPEPAGPLVEHLFRHESARILASLTRMLGVARLDLAEDAVQDALVAAMRHWPYRGVPDNPGAWLMRAARNRALDLLRREDTARDKEDDLARVALAATPEAETPPEVLDSTLRDDGLRLMAACCHPALPREARIALTLKALCGFGVPEIARAFLQPEPTIAQRLARAKRTLRRLDMPFDPPDAAALPERLDAVLDVLYLLFNEGYAAHAGDDLVRHDLCAEAIRLVTLLAEHPAADRPPVHAVRALMLLQAARLPARTDASGAIVLLEDQDRSLWDRRLIALGLDSLARAAHGDALTPYHLEAGIAVLHAVAPSHAATDWPRILDQYDALVRLTDSPVAALNRAVALAMVDGPAAALAALEPVRHRPGMAAYHLLHAVEASFHARLDDHPRAAAAYRHALALAPTTPERQFLANKIAQCEMVADP